MPLLISFVSYLNQEEKKRFLLMPLIGKEKCVRDFLVDHERSGIQKPILMQQAGVSSSHYDKICTLVLKKAYRHLAGEHPLDQMNFLSKRFMFRHLFHEIRQIKQHVMKLSAAERLKYRKAIFDFSINVPACYFEEPFVLQNAAEYLDTVEKDKESHALEVKAKLLFARLNVVTQKAPNAAANEQIKQEISELEENFKGVNQAEARAILYHIWINYYRMLEPDANKRTSYLHSIAALYGGVEKRPIFETALAGCHEAEVLYERGLYDEAFEQYNKSFSHYLPVLRNQFHHMARWIELAMLLQNHTKARQILDTHFKVYVENRHEANGVLGSLLYAQLSLLNGHLQEAFGHIGMAKSLNSIQVYFSYEIRIRIVETLFFAFSGDFEFVSRLAMRNIRYIQLQKIPLRTYKYAHYFYLLKELRDIKMNGRDHLPGRLQGFISEFSTGYDRIYGQLFEQLAGMK